MSDIAPPSLHYRYLLFIKYQDILGWQNFVEGRFLRYMVQLQREYLADRETWLTAESWSRGLIERVLRITHRQWLRRNATIYYRLPDGRTQAEKEALATRIMNLMWTDPSDLLPDDRELLDTDFEALGKADANDQAYWALEMESAIQATKHAAKRQEMSTPSGRSPPTYDTSPGLHDERGPSIDREGSLRFRRRRK